VLTQVKFGIGRIRNGYLLLPSYSQFENHAHKFSSGVLRASSQAISGIQLSIPVHLIENFDETSIDDYDAVHNLELLAEEWSNLVAKCLEEEMKMLLAKEIPLSEIEFWRRRYSVLFGLEEQINHPLVLRVVGLLKSVGTPMFHNVTERFTELSSLCIQAEDNSKFLFTLERQLLILTDESLSTITDSLPSLFDSMKIV